MIRNKLRLVMYGSRIREEEGTGIPLVRHGIRHRCLNCPLVFYSEIIGVAVKRAVAVAEASIYTMVDPHILPMSHFFLDICPAVSGESTNRFLHLHLYSPAGLCKKRRRLNAAFPMPIERPRCAGKNHRFIYSPEKVRRTFSAPAAQFSRTSYAAAGLK